MENLRNEKNFIIDQNFNDEDKITCIKEALNNGNNIICLLKGNIISPYILELINA